MGRLLRRTAKKKSGERHVTLIGKPGCHLCDDARAVVEAVCAETGAVWEEKDITQDEELHRAYWEQIPVVLVDGEQHTFWKVDAGRLRRALGG
ncbi:glutaredoxin family protein [Streptomyces sp. NPDC096176]|uniref:glutaredoxin family protein n=1 Tax=Streptomyces sp. NPDC096176 TaxID=3366079 RepID=UPI003828D7DE